MTCLTHIEQLSSSRQSLTFLVKMTLKRTILSTLYKLCSVVSTKKVHSWFFHLFFFVKFCFYIGMYYLQIYDNYTAIQSCYTMRGFTYIKDRTLRGLAKNALDVNDSQKLCNIHITQKLKILSNSVLSKINQHIQSLKYSNFAVKKNKITQNFIDYEGT